jgi:hypothetical protein
MPLLAGWPKKLASDWLKEARNHLEVKQALEVRLPLFLCPFCLPLLTSTHPSPYRSLSGKRRLRVSRRFEKGKEETDVEKLFRFCSPSLRVVGEVHRPRWERSMIAGKRKMQES